MIKKRFISMLVLLCLTVSGAWAQEGTLLTLTATVAEPTYTVSLKEGTDDATSWQGKAGSGEYQSLPLEGVAAGTAVTVKYNGTKKVKSVKAVKKGAFVWTSGSTEYIYVGGSEHADCLGVLSGTGTGTVSMMFNGTLTTTPNNGETLHFFYLGKGRDGSAVSTLDFSNQDGTLENVTNYHIAVGDVSYTSSVVNYATTLDMKMAIAYFDVSGYHNVSESETAETVYLHGEDVYTTATVDYQAGTITGATKGYLNMGKATAGKYVALIPSVTTQTTLKFDSNCKTGSMTFLRGIQEKKYYSNNNAALSIEANAIPAGTALGIFSVSETRKVRFSHGNLQYKSGEENPWRFALHQYDCIGAWNTSDYVDQYGWGTWSGTSEQWHPLTTSTNNSSYPWYGDEYFKATLYGYNDWFTFSGTEWQYLFGHSTYGMAKVGDYNGIIILPDDLDLTINTTHNNWTNNTYTTDEWDNNLEPVGIVFLRAAGAHHPQHQPEYVNSHGMYWSSTPVGTKAKQILFSSNSMNSYFTYDRHHGRAVRLVRDL